MKEKYLSWRIKLEKNLRLLHGRKIILSPAVYEKKNLTQKPNHPYPPPPLPQKSNGRSLTFQSSIFHATNSQTLDLIATFVALKIIHRNAFVANVKKPTVLLRLPSAAGVNCRRARARVLPRKPSLRSSRVTFPLKGKRIYYSQVIKAGQRLF